MLFATAVLSPLLGAIVLTLRSRDGVRRQDAGTQTGRTRAESVEIRKVAPGGGV